MTQVGGPLREARLFFALGAGSGSGSTTGTRNPSIKGRWLPTSLGASGCARPGPDPQ
jgi:hypothetical protein